LNDALLSSNLAVLSEIEPPSECHCSCRKKIQLSSFHPETAFSRCGGVNLQAYLCGVTVYASVHKPLMSLHNGKLLVSNLKIQLLPSNVSG